MMDKKMSARFNFTAEQRIKRPIDEVFSFFSKAENLELITPPWLNFQILTPLPIEMKTGTLIDYKIGLYGIPLKWKTEITRWQPPFGFIDTQLKGPYSVWIHQHLFKEHNGVTIMTDSVDYDIPGWFLKPWLNKFFISQQVEAIFAYRKKVINTYFSGETSQND
jgi:ligand-binding SRPBCC domain-containing protein